MILARKIIKIPEFLYLPEKFTKCPNFYMIFPEKCPDFTFYLPEKYFSVILGGGARAPLPPISYIYARMSLSGLIVHIFNGK